MSGDVNVRLPSSQDGWTVEEQVKKHQGGSIMDIEKEIEDLEIEKAKLEGSPVILNTMNSNGWNEFQEKTRMRHKSWKAIDSQLEELRNKLASDIKAQNEGALHGKDSNGQNTV